eukprot:CAMPEP_0185799708 /NCGR_PEP_ID=MMETSP1322-20130828/470_1 /TAXON_ID=265543 /ORGANISM="Minutocellus polymorphus, Strain RCC2270" /LENGTH=204 /DNA_ID=CAMNT_0028495295 /DNA_START=161 /DNA_END=776 /DNA_ORIENTATION=+
MVACLDLEGAREIAVDLVAFVLAGLTDVDLATGTERGMLITAAFVATDRSFLGTAGATTERALHELLAIIDVVEASARARRQVLVAVVKVTHVRAAQALLLTLVAKVLVVAPLMDLVSSQGGFLGSHWGLQPAAQQTPPPRSLQALQAHLLKHVFPEYVFHFTSLFSQAFLRPRSTLTSARSSLAPRREASSDMPDARATETRR